LIEAIGPAPNTGRRGWIELAELFKSPKLIDVAQKAAVAPLTQAQDSDARFSAVLAAVKPAPAKSRIDVLKDGEGVKIGKLATNTNRLVVTVDRKYASGFADYLAEKLPGLIAEFTKRGAGKTGP
jgi:ParB family chromosome partitioning protein